MSLAQEIENLRLAMLARNDEALERLAEFDRVCFECDASLMRELQSILTRLDGRRGDIAHALHELAGRVDPRRLPPPYPNPQQRIGGNSG